MIKAFYLKVTDSVDTDSCKDTESVKVDSCCEESCEEYSEKSLFELRNSIR